MDVQRSTYLTNMIWVNWHLNLSVRINSTKRPRANYRTFETKHGSEQLPNGRFFGTWIIHGSVSITHFFTSYDWRISFNRSHNHTFFFLLPRLVVQWGARRFSSFFRELKRVASAVDGAFAGLSMTWSSSWGGDVEEARELFSDDGEGDSSSASVTGAPRGQSSSSVMRCNTSSALGRLVGSGSVMACQLKEPNLNLSINFLHDYFHLITCKMTFNPEDNSPTAGTPSLRKICHSSPALGKGSPVASSYNVMPRAKTSTLVKSDGLPCKASNETYLTSPSSIELELSGAALPKSPSNENYVKINQGNRERHLAEKEVEKRRTEAFDCGKENCPCDLVQFLTIIQI